MDKEKIIQRLQQIKEITEECLSDLSGQKATGKLGGKHKTQKVSSYKSLIDHILGLRDGGLFKQSKSAREIHTRLKTTYPCDLNRVEVALVRLSQKKQLRKTSKLQNNKKIVAYVW